MIEDKVKAFAAENNLSLEEMLRILSVEERKETERELQEKIEQNNELVGKCFYGQALSVFRGPHDVSGANEYFKVVSNVSENEYRVECLVFPEKLNYRFEPQMHKMYHPGDLLFGKYRVRTFTVESIMVSTLKKMKEVKEEDYNKAAEKFLKEILSSRWEK